MIKLSKKSLLLFVVAVASMASASSASAASFDGVGSHQLRSINLGFTSATLGAGAGCTTSDFTVVVPAGGATASVTAASFSGCTGTGALAGLTVHATGTGLPWPITRIAPGSFSIDGIHVTNNVTGFGHITLEGNLTGTIDCTPTRTVTFANSGDLTATSAIGNGAATVSGIFTDSLNTLCVT
jgi:hypothetical protein